MGGPSGKHTVAGRMSGTFFTPMRVLILLTVLSAVVTILVKSPCRLNGWGAPDVYFAGCYSDWTALYGTRGLLENAWAPFSAGSTFEYPVLTSVVASMTAAIAQMLPGHDMNPSLLYFDVNLIFTVILWIITVIVTAKSAGRRPWDAAMVALAPGMILASTVNWDIWAVALLALGMWFWGGNKPVWAGACFGLGIAVKVFPLMVFGALLILAVRTLRFRPLLLAAGSGVVTWLAVNLPLMIFNFSAWEVFYTFSSERAPGWSSIWNVWNLQFSGTEWEVTGENLGALATGSFVVCCALIFLVGVTVKQRPRLAQLTLLIVAAFILCNKVYSPQFVIWLIPLVALALPNWRDFLIWQFVEVLHFWAVWSYLSNQSSGHETEHSFDENLYAAAVIAHVLATGYIMVRVLFQMYYPDTDPVRASTRSRWARNSTAQHHHWDPDDVASLPVDDPLGGAYDGDADRAPWLVRQRKPHKSTGVDKSVERGRPRKTTVSDSPHGSDDNDFKTDTVTDGSASHDHH